jgi:hypothetical protein
MHIAQQTTLRLGLDSIDKALWQFQAEQLCDDSSFDKDCANAVRLKQKRTVRWVDMDFHPKSSPIEAVNRIIDILAQSPIAAVIMQVPRSPDDFLSACQTMVELRHASRVEYPRLLTIAWMPGMTRSEFRRSLEAGFSLAVHQVHQIPSIFNKILRFGDYQSVGPHPWIDQATIDSHVAESR